MKHIGMALAALLLPVLHAHAQECDRSDETQMGLNFCARADYEAADAVLNAAYREMVKRQAGDAESLGLLKQAQRAWIAFRDAECTFRTADTAAGSIHPMVYAACLQQLTEERTRQLQAQARCEEGDLSCNN